MSLLKDIRVGYQEIGGMILQIVDIVTDILVIINLLKDEQYFYFGIAAIVFLVLPSLAQAGIFAYTESKLHALFGFILGPIWTSIQHFRGEVIEPIFQRYSRLSEVILEAIPQSTLQLYVLFNKWDEIQDEIFSVNINIIRIVSIFVTIFWGSWELYHSWDMEELRLRDRSKLLNIWFFIYRLFSVTGRLILFTYVLQTYGIASFYIFGGMYLIRYFIALFTKKDFEFSILKIMSLSFIFGALLAIIELPYAQKPLHKKFFVINGWLIILEGFVIVPWCMFVTSDTLVIYEMINRYKNPILPYVLFGIAMLTLVLQLITHLFIIGKNQEVNEIHEESSQGLPQSVTDDL